MTVWVPEYLSKNKTESSDDQTLYIDLPKNEQISHLFMEVSMQGIATPRTTTTLIDKIEKYEVIADGSKVLFSLEPEIAYYDHFVSLNGQYPHHSFNYTPNARETHEFMLCFGRHPFDDEWFLDTSLYNNVQLRIPYSTDGTHFTSGTFRHNIIMYRPLQRLNYQGFVRRRTVRKETSNTAVETINHDIPTTYPLRYLGVRFEDLDAGISTDCTAIKINIDEGRLILADLNINEWMDFDQMRYPQCGEYEIVGAFTNETYVKSHTDTAWPKAIVNSGTRALMYKIYAAAGEQVALNVYEQDGTTVSDSHATIVHVDGPHPHKCMTLIDGRKDPFDVTQYTEGKVEYTMAAYETIIHTFVQEMVRGTL